MVHRKEINGPALKSKKEKKWLECIEEIDTGMERGGWKGWQGVF